LNSPCNHIKIEGIPKRYTSKGFARGNRRFIDWLEWMVPEAWDKEHNDLHHYNLGEKADPDQVEFNMEEFLNIKMPMPVRYLFLGLMACTWKFIYYAPSTLKELRNFKAKKAGEVVPEYSRADEWNPLKPEGWEESLHTLIAFSISNSVSGRGIRTSELTRKSRDQNS